MKSFELYLMGYDDFMQGHMEQPALPDDEDYLDGWLDAAAP